MKWLMVEVLGKYVMLMMGLCVRGYREKDVRDGNVNDGSSTLPR